MVLDCSLSKGLVFQGRGGENKGDGYNLKGTSRSLKSYMNLVSQIALDDLSLIGNGTTRDQVDQPRFRDGI